MSPAKIAEPIEMPFALWARMCPRNHVLDGCSEVLRDVALATIFGRPFVKRFTLCYGPLSVLFVCLSVTLNGWMDQDETWHGGRPRPRRRCVRLGPSSPPQKKWTVFGLCLLWPNGRPSQLILITCLVFDGDITFVV